MFKTPSSIDEYYFACAWVSIGGAYPGPYRLISALAGTPASEFREGIRRQDLFDSHCIVLGEAVRLNLDHGLPFFHVQVDAGPGNHQESIVADSIHRRFR